MTTTSNLPIAPRRLSGERLLALRSVQHVQGRITKANIPPDCDGASVEIDVHASSPH